MDDSAAFLKKIGLVDSATETDAFLEKTCKMKVFPPLPGSFFATSILQWSFDADSFWRTPDMATVYDISKSIAVAGWKDGRALACDFPTVISQWMMEPTWSLMSKSFGSTTGA